MIAAALSLGVLMTGWGCAGPVGDVGEVVRVRTAGGDVHEGEIVSWESGGRLVLAVVGGANIEIASRDVDDVSFVQAASKPPSGGWVIETRDRMRLFGQIVSGNEAGVVVRQVGIGEISVPLDRLVSIRTRRPGGNAATSAAGEATVPGAGGPDMDEVFLANGDVMDVVVTGVRREGAAILRDDREQTLSWKVIRAIRFAASSSPVGVKMGVRLHLVDGSVVPAASLQWQGKTLIARLGGGQTLRCDASWLARVEVIGGRHVRLRDLVPSEYRSTPFFDRSWPLRVNRNALGGKLRIDGKAYALGLGLHAACLIRWKLDGNYERFTGLVGIDDSAGAWADADVTIRVDSKTPVVFKGLLHLQPPRRIDVDLRGGRELVIEVGFGRNGDVQDRVDLVNAALIRAASAAATTRPGPFR